MYNKIEYPSGNNRGIYIFYTIDNIIGKWGRWGSVEHYNHVIMK